MKLQSTSSKGVSAEQEGRATRGDARPILQPNDLLDCPVVSTLKLIQGKWKPHVLRLLAEGTMRFGEIRRTIPGVSQKVLSQQLRELEDARIIHREVFPEVPPRVEYSLTERGEALKPILQELYTWGLEHRTP